MFSFRPGCRSSSIFYFHGFFFFHQENLDLVVAKGIGKRRTVLRSGSVVRKRDPVTGGEV